MHCARPPVHGIAAATLRLRVGACLGVSLKQRRGLSVNMRANRAQVASRSSALC